MKRISAVLALLSLACVGAAQAGSLGAGPAASGSTAVGSIVNPGSSSVLDMPAKDAEGQLTVPGGVGTVELDATQLTQAADFMRAAEGVVVEGSLLKLLTTLEDGDSATIILDTATGKLSVSRNES